MLFIYTQHGYLYLLIYKCLLFGIICTMTLTPHFLWNIWTIILVWNVLFLHTKLLLLSFWGGYSFFIHSRSSVYVQNSLNLKLPRAALQREAGCPGVLSLESWISGGFNFCFTLHFLLTLELAELWHPGVISSEHSSGYFKVASILSLVPVLMFMNRYDRKMA